ncbi:MAG: hypothetical protein Q9184_007861, partial [Pyrenodesmia sp. 2 TL-2023]
SPLVITGIHIDFDGREFGPIITTFPIREYTGERSTASLPLCPTAFMKDPSDLKKDLELQGQRFIELAQISHREHSGLTIEPIEDIDSQVIVDFGTTSGTVRSLYMHEDASIDQARMKDFMEDNPIFRRDPPVFLQATSEGIKLNNDYKRLLPGRALGFVLRSRTWAALSIRLLRDLPRKPDGFEQLVLPDGHKDLVRALVKTHLQRSRPASGQAEEKELQVDLMKGKGKGLIILLHGVPGVGKTSTAECIADYAQRPLFPITCGDIGETAAMVEANLGKSFQLAQELGCVVLLDEADVFMAKRTNADIQRNSLVSAFKSRIHISVYYPPLDGPTTVAIWRVNIARSKSSEKNYKIEEEEIIKYAKNHFRTHEEGSR